MATNADGSREFGPEWDASREVEIVRGEIADIGRLSGLWLQLHHHHQRVAPRSGEFVDDTTSWRARSSAYRKWLSDPRSFLLLAGDGEELLGYAVVSVGELDEVEDAWRVPAVGAEVQTLVVAAGARGQGLGSRLLDAIEAELERQGVQQVVIGVMPGNEQAQRLYERRGFEPRWLELVRGLPR